MTTFMDLLSFCPSFTWSISGLTEYICISDTGDEMNIQKIVIQEKIYSYNLKNLKTVNIITLNDFEFILDQIVYERNPEEFLLHQIAWTGSVKSFRPYWNDFWR